MDRSAAVSRLDKLLDNVFRRNGNIHGCMISVATGSGSFEWTRYLGLADEDKQIPLTVETPFFIASITKLFTATVIMRLVEQGKLQLNDAMAQVLPPGMIAGIHVYKGVDYSSQISIRHLLSHTSGIADYYMEKVPGGQSFFEQLLADTNEEGSVEDTIARVREKLSPNFQPGVRASYSYTNFQLLGFVIEAVTGKALHDVYAEYLFEPLQMEHSWLYMRSKPAVNPESDTAQIYYRDMNITARDGFKLSWADGGIVSTLADCMKFMRALHRGEIFSQADTLAWMHAWRKLEFPLQYGFGTMRLKLPRIFSPFAPVPELIGHFGSTGALLYSEKMDTYLAITINQADARSKLVQLIMAIMQVRCKVEGCT